MNWYYAEGNHRKGPVEEKEFNDLVRQGIIGTETKVWRQGMEDWQQLKEIGHVPPPERDARTLETPALSGAPAGAEASLGTCSVCGRRLPDDSLVSYKGSLVCAACKPEFLQRLREGGGIPTAMVYGGFWVRFGAKLLDWIILAFISTAFTVAISFLMQSPVAESGEVDPRLLVRTQLALSLLQLAIGVSYTTWFLGKFAATPGKMALGLKVARSDGASLTYLRAFARHFAEMLSGIMLTIGYIMAAFDSEKRALHDRICDTRVIKKR